MFVVIEGLDGVGKTTLVEKLAQYCGGYAMSTPSTSLRPFLDSVIQSLGRNQLARCLVYAATVVESGNTARLLSNRGHTVFMDRYWLSTIAYARARGVSNDLSCLEALVPIPDCTILVTISEPERRKRLAGRSTTYADRETLELNFRSKVLQEMRRKDRLLGLHPIEIDVTGYDRSSAMGCILKLISQRCQQQSLVE